MSGLAAERTALSWRRTGLSYVAATCVLLRLDTTLSAATCFGLAAAALTVLTATEIRQRQLRTARPSQPHPRLTFTTAAAVALAGFSLLLDRA